MPADLEWLFSDIRAARGSLPIHHRRLLEDLRVQEKVVTDWPAEVLDLYETLLETPPRPTALDGAAAVWLNGLRTVAFNGPLLQRAALGLDDPTRRLVVARIAWHEYGHALSVPRHDLVEDFAAAVGHVRTDGYVQPEYLHPRVFAAFQEVIPWPRTP
jgi:hypothetical protein